MPSLRLFKPYYLSVSEKRKAIHNVLSFPTAKIAFLIPYGYVPACGNSMYRDERGLPAIHNYILLFYSEKGSNADRKMYAFKLLGSSFGLFVLVGCFCFCLVLFWSLFKLEIQM